MVLYQEDPEVHSSELSMHPPHCTKDLHGYLQPRLLLNVPFPPSPSLLVKTSSSIAPLLVDSCMTWRRMLSSMHSRNLLDCLCPVGLSLHQVLGWLYLLTCAHPKIHCAMRLCLLPHFSIHNKMFHRKTYSVPMHVVSKHCNNVNYKLLLYPSG